MSQAPQLRPLGAALGTEALGIDLAKPLEEETFAWIHGAFARVFSIFPDAHFGSPRHFLAGDRGCTEWTFTGTGADGKRVEVLGCDLFTFRDGKIALKSSYFKNRLG